MFIQRSLIKISNIFNGVKGYGYFRGIRKEIVQNSDANLYREIVEDAKKYLKE